MRTKQPFEIIEIEAGYHLTLYVCINGLNARMLIDTGASRTILDWNQIDNYLDPKDVMQNYQLSAGISAEKVISYISIVKEMKIGTILIDNYNTFLIDLSEVNKQYKEMGLLPIQGILGSDVFLKYGAVIDYQKKIISFGFE